jgi:cysteinyl-tRNA synthetase
MGGPGAYLDRIIADGYDGIYMDWLEAYAFGPVAAAATLEGKDARKEMASLVKAIGAYARALKPGFLLVGQNATALSVESDYLLSIDAQAQEHPWFMGDPNGAAGDITIAPVDTQGVIQELNVFKAVGKPVFTCDYAFVPAHVSACYAQASALGFIEYVTDVQLDRLTSTPPPGY